MKCSGRIGLAPSSFSWVACSLAASLAACAGGTGGGNEGGSGGTSDEPPDVKSPDSYKRNPVHELACEQPLTSNPLSSPLQRLSNVEYANTVRALLAPVGDSSQVGKDVALPHESLASGFSTNILYQDGSEDYVNSINRWALEGAAFAVTNLPKLMGCTPKSAGEETSCAASFVRAFGKRAFRRPLTTDETTALEALYAEARAANLSFKDAVETVVGGMLQSPQLMFRVEEGVGDVTDSGGKALSDYEVASRLSYMLWDSPPDDALFAAAEAGKLVVTTEIEKQVKRMLAEPEARPAMAAFEREWLNLELVASQIPADRKDTTMFPEYTPAAAKALEEGMNRFIEDSFFAGDHSMNRLFTSSVGFVNDDSAAIYGVDAPGGSDLVAVDLDPATRKGLLTQPGFTAGLGHQQTQASIIRGATIMDRILCMPSPPPPDSVDRTIKDLGADARVTYRQRVEMTVEENRDCSGCHFLIDSYGFLYENYNAIGAFQEQEGKFDLPVDASVEIAGTYDLDGKYDNGVAFAAKLGQSEQAAQCAVESLYRYTFGRNLVDEDGCAIAPLTDAFVAKKFDMHALLAEFAKSPAFRFRSAAAAE